MSDGIYVSQGKNALLNVSASTVVAQGAGVGFYSGGPKGRAQRVNVLVAGTTAGGVYDSSTIAGAVAAAQLAAIPNVIGSYLVDMPFFVGLTVVPGAGQTVSISYD